jgi:hypothetical protein
VGRAGRWMVAGLVTMAAFVVATWVSGVFLFTRLLPSPDVRWPTAFVIGAAVAAFIGLWGQSWATESGSQVSAEQLAPAEQREREARDQLRQYLGRQDRLPQMDETSALVLGVHHAIDLPRSPQPTAAPGAETDSPLDQDLPAFVDRDKGQAITSWMRRAREDGGFLVLVGNSSVGKTRLLYETARNVLPDFAVLAPDLGDGALVNSIAAATFPLPRLIVWLDGLQRFFDGPYLTPGSIPIKAAAVRQLLDAPTSVVVLGAMWPEHAARLRETGPDPYTPGQRLRYPGAADILGGGRVRQEPLKSFSETERETAAKLSSGDPRLAKALADGDYNVTEVLAGAPQLVARYEQATEEQQAVLNAAIDARRLGIQAPLTGTLLRAAARGYLSTLHRNDTWLPAALTELTQDDRPQDHATAPLIPKLNQEKSEILGYTVADYLLQYASWERLYARVPASTWDAILSNIRDPADTARLADSARYRLLYRYAVPLYGHAADAGDRYAAEQLAWLLAERGDLDGLRARADGGDRTAERLAWLLAAHGNLDRAALVYPLWPFADYAFEAALPARSLANEFAGRGDLDGLRTRADGGDLDELLAAVGYLDGLRARADAGDWHAASRLAELLAAVGDLDGLRAQADVGNRPAAERLASLLAERGDLDGLRAQADVGNRPAAAQLIGLLKKQGRDEEADRLRRFGLNPDGSIASA